MLDFAWEGSYFTALDSGALQRSEYGVTIGPRLRRCS
jgi:hypothetical protein